MSPERLLILGGTSQARSLLTHLHDHFSYDLHYGLSKPHQALWFPHRDMACLSPCFENASQLAEYLTHHNIGALIDATHPFAHKISQYAHQASQKTHLPLLTFTRPPWLAANNHLWHGFETWDEGAKKLTFLGKRAFLSIGSHNLKAFNHVAHHIVAARTFRPISSSCIRLIYQTEPLSMENEKNLFQTLKVDLLVTKNSGGHRTYHKIKAAEKLNIPLLILKRPPTPCGSQTHNLKDVIVWLLSLKS